MKICSFCKKEFTEGSSSNVCDLCRALIMSQNKKESHQEKELRESQENILRVVKFGIIYTLMISLFTYFELYDYSYTGYLEAIVILFLTRWIYHKSKLSAIVLFLFFLGSKIFSLAYGNWPWLVMFLVYILFFILFGEGIYTTHLYSKKEKKSFSKLQKLRDRFQ